jgi:NAD(P)-dependent dehydrogenase (short-subunit alcohol dehydrogenase family)
MRRWCERQQGDHEGKLAPPTWINTIAPGRINSAQIQRLHPTEQSRADFIKQNIPAGYFGEPYDIGYLAAFLSSPHQWCSDPGRRRCRAALSLGVMRASRFAKIADMR